MNISLLKIKLLKYFAFTAVIAVLLSGCAANIQNRVVEKEKEAAKKAASDQFLEGKMAEANEDWSKAIASYTEALQYDPRSDEIAAALAKVFLRDGKYRSSLYYTKMAIRYNSTNPDYWRRFVPRWDYPAGHPADQRHG